MNLASIAQAQVKCATCGPVTLTEHEYHEQLLSAGSRWKCPKCSRPADFDQHHWERLHLEATRNFYGKEEL